jgi:nucleotide-binding universal stress UspA family protein
MLRSLLVPLDGSTFSERSLPFAGKIARATGASMHLAHVHVPYEPDSLLGDTQFQFEGVNVAEYDAQDRDREEEYLTGLVGKLADAGAPVDLKMLDGSEVAEELAAYADEVQTDMIFMTTHGHSGANRLWLGSVVDEMVRRTKLPLFVIHPEEHGTLPDGVFSVRHILIPLDGSKLAESVIDPATEVARATGARITLVHVVPTPEMSGWPVLPALRERPVPKLDGAIAYLEGIADELRGEGLDVRTHAMHGAHAAVTIAGVAESLNADVIALATHGRGGLKRAFLGSVADKLLRSSTLPLLVMRPPALA